MQRSGSGINELCQLRRQSISLDKNFTERVNLAHDRGGTCQAWRGSLECNAKEGLPRVAVLKGESAGLHRRGSGFHGVDDLRGSFWVLSCTRRLLQSKRGAHTVTDSRHVHQRLLHIFAGSAVSRIAGIARVAG